MVFKDFSLKMPAGTMDVAALVLSSSSACLSLHNPLTPEGMSENDPRPRARLDLTLLHAIARPQLHAPLIPGWRPKHFFSYLQER